MSQSQKAAPFFLRGREIKGEKPEAKILMEKKSHIGRQVDPSKGARRKMREGAGEVRVTCKLSVKKEGQQERQYKAKLPVPSLSGCQKTGSTHKPRVGGPVSEKSDKKTFHCIKKVWGTHVRRKSHDQRYLKMGRGKTKRTSRL